MDWLIDRMLVVAIICVPISPAYFFVQPMAIKKWKGGWRIAAMAPLLLTLAAIPYSIMGIIQNSNLWPLGAMCVLGLGSAYLLVLWAVKAGREHLTGP